jgi:hypothetical protein
VSERYGFLTLQGRVGDGEMVPAICPTLRLLLHKKKNESERLGWGMKESLLKSMIINILEDIEEETGRRKEGKVSKIIFVL